MSERHDDNGNKCDIYVTKCEGCGVEIGIEICLFSQSRRNVKTWCPRCNGKMLQYIKENTDKYDTGEWTLFSDVVGDPDEYEHDFKEGGIVHFLVTTPYVRLMRAGGKR